MRALEIFNIAITERYAPTELNRVSAEAPTLYLQLKTLKDLRYHSGNFFYELYISLLLLKPHWQKVIEQREEHLLKRISLWFEMSFSKTFLSQSKAIQTIKMVKVMVKKGK